jgi:hypothetical protein
VERQLRELLALSVAGSLEILAWQADRLDPVRRAIRREILEDVGKVLAAVE